MHVVPGKAVSEDRTRAALCKQSVIPYSDFTRAQMTYFNIFSFKEKSRNPWESKTMAEIKTPGKRGQILVAQPEHRPSELKPDLPISCGY